MRLLVLNQATDTADPILGFATRWLAALARRVERVDVLTMRAGAASLPENVRVFSVGKERGYGEPRRAVEFYRRLGTLVGTEQVDACFSHMIPVFSVMAAPVLRLRGIPLVTWHAHRHVSPLLRLAHHVSDRMATSAPSSYGYRRDKLAVLGQGIDTTAFAPGGRGAEAPPLVLAVGRLSPVKRLETLVDAVRRLHARGDAMRCAVVGEAPVHHRAYANALRAAAGADVEFVGPVPYAELPAWYRRATVHVNLSPTGALDKSALEAMACGRPSVVANAGFAATLGPHADTLLVRDAEPAALADQLASVLAMTPGARATLGAALRERICREHDLDRLAGRIVALLHELGAPA
jgi:glycosyltransferase involved in cell wall biosynthesis